MMRFCAGLLFVYFADAQDVPRPCAAQHWEGAIRVVSKCLALDSHEYRNRVAHVIVPTCELDAHSHTAVPLSSSRSAT